MRQQQRKCAHMMYNGIMLSYKKSKIFSYAQLLKIID